MTMNNEMDVKRILDIVMSDYLRKLYTFCLRETRNHADAEDLCQDILTEIVYSARSLRQPGALAGWVWTIARRTHSRWVKQHEQAEPLPDSIWATYICPVNALLEAEQVQQLLEACDRSTVLRRRDFAVTMLLARLGLACQRGRRPVAG